MSDTEGTTTGETTAPEGQTTATGTPQEGTPAPEAKTYDEATVKGLRTEAASFRTRLRDTEATLTSTQAELTAARESLSSLEPRASQAEALATKYRVALDAGLPRNLAERLVGDDEEALKADAEALKALIGTTAPTPDFDQGQRTPPPAQKASISDALRALAGK